MANYKKITSEFKRELKRLNENGASLVDLSIRYDINYGTLKNISSKEGWKKGSKKLILQNAIVEDDIKNRLELRNEVIKQYRDIHGKFLDELGGDIKPGQSKEMKDKILATSELYKMGKELYNIQTPNEQIEYELKLLKCEEKKKKIESNSDVIYLEDGDIFLG